MRRPWQACVCGAGMRHTGSPGTGVRRATGMAPRPRAQGGRSAAAAGAIANYNRAASRSPGPAVEINGWRDLPGYGAVTCDAVVIADLTKRGLGILVHLADKKSSLAATELSWCWKLLGLQLSFLGCQCGRQVCHLRHKD